MLHRLLASTIALALCTASATGCATPSATPLTQGLVSGAASAGNSTANVSGRVTSSGKWCKGMAPGPGEMQAVQRRRPTSKLLLFRPGGTNTAVPPVAEVTASGPEARFSVTLPPGTWCVISSDKRDVAPVATVKPGGALGAAIPARGSDPACLARLKQRCDAIVTVVAGKPTAELDLNYVQQCGWGGGPCYRGPYPPSAAPRGR